MGLGRSNTGETDLEKLAKIKQGFVKAAIGFAVFLPVFMAGAALGTRFGLWDVRFGFGTLVREYGPKLMILTLVIGLVAFILALLVKPRKGWLLALLAMAVPLTAMTIGKNVAATAEKLPFIHDITTDTQDVPTFSAKITAQRGAHSNSLDYVDKLDPRSKKLVSVEQLAAFPDIRTLALPLAPDAAFERALAAAEAMGWDIITNEAGKGMIEATSTTFWFGFKDDVVIRIRAAQGGSSHIDIRSISRVGGSDLGANAARVRKFLDKISG